MRKPRMMFFHDGRHPHIYLYEPPMQKEEYAAAVDELSGTTIDALMFCLGEGRTFLHDTKVGELWGHNVDKWPHIIWRRTHQNAKALIEAGNDPLRIICDRAHEKGILLYPTLLVQVGSDERGAERATWVRCSDFRFDNKHLEIGARGGVDEGFPGLDGLDFMREEVRQERFAIIEEVVRNYPVDGFELQMNHTPYYFRPDEAEGGRAVMTEWVARVHDLVKSSGADRELVIRVPANPDDCMDVGLDVRGWIDRGIVDVLVGDDSVGDTMNQMADFRPLVEAARGSKCRVHAAVKHRIDSDRVGDATIEMVRAAASNYWAQGIDGLYMARGWFYNYPHEAPFYEKIREMPQPDIMAAKDKYYRLPSHAPGPKPNSKFGIDFQLPVPLELNRPAAVEFTISDDLPRWDDVGRVYEALLRVRIQGTTELDRIEFRLNGRKLPASILRIINQMFWMSGPRGAAQGYWFVFNLDRGHWPAKGANTLEITLLDRDPDVTPPVLVMDVELELKYLMGKHFRRGYEDPALGPFEGRMGGPW